MIMTVKTKVSTESEKEIPGWCIWIKHNFEVKTEQWLGRQMECQARKRRALMEIGKYFSKCRQSVGI